jgi:hypothetical protein
MLAYHEYTQVEKIDPACYPGTWQFLDGATNLFHIFLDVNSMISMRQHMLAY